MSSTVLIIGAGVSGLSTAALLAHENIDLKNPKERDVYGDFVIPLKNKNYVDVFDPNAIPDEVNTEYNIQLIRQNNIKENFSYSLLNLNIKQQES